MTSYTDPLHCPVCCQECPSGPRPVPVWDCRACGVTFRVTLPKAEAPPAPVHPDSYYLGGAVAGG